MQREWVSGSSCCCRDLPVPLCLPLPSFSVVSIGVVTIHRSRLPRPARQPATLGSSLVQAPDTAPYHAVHVAVGWISLPRRRYWLPAEDVTLRCRRARLD